MATYASCLAEDGSGDIVTELQPMPNAIVKDPPAEAQTVPTLNDVQEYAFNDPTNGQVPLSATDVDALERWNSPKKNRWRVFATFTSEFVGLPSKCARWPFLIDASFWCNGHVRWSVSCHLRYMSYD